MDTIYFILLLLGFICFVLDAMQVRHSRFAFLGAGLAFWILVPLIHAANDLGR